MGECGEKLDHHRRILDADRHCPGDAGRAGSVTARDAVAACDHGDPDLAHDRADHHYRDGDVLLLLEPLRTSELAWTEPGMRTAGRDISGRDPGPCDAGDSLCHHYRDRDADRF